MTGFAALKPSAGLTKRLSPVMRGLDPRIHPEKRF
jgi:hypothetical protein